MGVISNNLIHRLTHHWEDEVALCGTVVHLLITDTESAPAAGQIVKVQFLIFFAKLFYKVVVVADDRAKLVGDRPASFSCFFLCVIHGIMLNLFLTEIATGINQLTDSFLNLIPFEKHFGIRLHNAASADFDTFRVVAFIKVTVSNCRISTAYAVFVLEEGDVVLRRFLFEILFVYTVFAVIHTAAACQHRINIFLRNSKSGGFICLRFCYDFLLFFDSRKIYA